MLAMENYSRTSLKGKTPIDWVEPIYLIPRTAILGAVLLTGYLGGAVASHMRVSNPLFTHTLFPVYIAVLLWLGLYLRDARLRNTLAKQ